MCVCVCVLCVCVCVCVCVTEDRSRLQEPARQPQQRLREDRARREHGLKQKGGETI